MGNGYRQTIVIWSIIADLTCMVLPCRGQWHPKDTEWPTYTADLAGSKYRPLNQIDASNFSKLEIAWRFKTDNLGTRPEYKLEGHTVDGEWCDLRDRWNPPRSGRPRGQNREMVWIHSVREGLRAAVSPRQLSGRGLAFWSDGKGDDRVIYVTTGYRLMELNAHNGQVIQSFGKEGIIDLKTGMVTGTGRQIDLETGEAGLHSAPTVVNDVVIVGSAFKEGMTVPTHNNTKDWSALAFEVG